jgi:acyl-CoA synthetase (AMP-forming)/AMP-acid ligase II
VAAFRGGFAAVRAEDHRAGDDCVLASARWPRTDVEVRIVDADDQNVPAGEVGEVVVRGDVVMRGYWNDEAATAERRFAGAWLHTGDIGRLDADGKLHLLDRRNDVIITGGVNVHPREVEEALLRHPSVAEAAVFGIPHPVWGEQIGAAIVFHPGRRLDAAEVVAHCRGPHRGLQEAHPVAFLESLPKNAYGKILRRKLRDRLASDEHGLDAIDEHL